MKYSPELTGIGRISTKVHVKHLDAGRLEAHPEADALKAALAKTNGKYLKCSNTGLFPYAFSTVADIENLRQIAESDAGAQWLVSKVNASLNLDAHTPHRNVILAELGPEGTATAPKTVEEGI